MARPEAEYVGRLEECFVESRFKSEVWFVREPVDVERGLRTLERGAELHQGLVSQGNALDEESWGCYQYLNAIYLRECWVGECGPIPEIDTVEVALRVVGGIRVEGVAERSLQKVINLQGAIAVALGMGSKEDLARAVEEPCLSVELILEVHRRVGEGLFDDAGKTREVDVGPAGMAIIYCPWRKVVRRLSALVDFVRSKMRQSDSLEYRIRLGAVFFSEFLLIRPFRNGNGRTARVILNAILRKSMIVPFVLFQSERQTLTDLLVEAQQRKNLGPLSTYLLRMAVSTTHMMEYLLC